MHKAEDTVITDLPKPEVVEEHKMKRAQRLISWCIVLMLCCTFTIACASQSIDYSQQDNWAYYQVGQEKDADLFIVCPTVDMGKNGNKNMSMTDVTTKENFIGALNMERGLYEDTLTLYAPFYRQASFPVYSLPSEEAEVYFSIAYQDVRDAFLYFISHTEQDRPFVLAGFSQGSDMVIRLLKEEFSDESLQKRLIAAYCIGWRITQDDLDACPWLKPAQSEDDTGVIVSFNSESESVTDSLMVPAGVKTFSINPLNWRTDGTVAVKEENAGACFTDYSGKIKKEIASFTGAYIDTVRGTLKVTDVAPEDYANKLFPDGVYHLYDYQFFYRNIQANVALRTMTYFQENSEDAAA